MDELITKLKSIQDSYYGFVVGIIAYAKYSDERIDRINKFIDNNDNLTSSDVVYFVMNQPDFHENGLGAREMVG